MKSADKKWPFIQWFISDWLADPKVSLCEPATRGILFDWICNMHALDRCGVITGPLEILARLGRCSPVQCEAALQDLQVTNAADVTVRNGLVTVINRRMKREYYARKSSKDRVDRHRNPDSPPDCNGSVTPHIQKSESRTQNPEPDPTCPINRTLEAVALERIAGAIVANEWGWFYDNCKVKLTDFTRASLVTVLKPYVGKVTEQQLEKAWREAITRAHKAVVDNLVRTTPGGYAIACFRDILDGHRETVGTKTNNA